MQKYILSIFIFITITTLSAQIKNNAKAHDFHHVNKQIISLFNQYPLVGVGEGMHNSALTAEWLESLIGEKEFSKIVRNIVVEFGTSKYQSVMDDFISGKDVPDSLLNKCWRNTTQMFVWDNPIYENFFRQIRKINTNLPNKQKIRVLLADLPFEKRAESRDLHAFNVVKNEVLFNKQTALLIFGDLHFVRRDVFLNYASPIETAIEDQTLVQMLELQYPGKIFSIWGSVNTNDSSIKKIITDDGVTFPSLHITSGSKLGSVDFNAYYPWADERTDAKGIPIDSTQYLSLPIREIVDGILYRGEWEDQIERIAPRPDEIYSDTAYVNELIMRAKMSGELGRQIIFEYFRFRWSGEYNSFLEILETMDSSLIDQNFQVIKNKFSEFQWLPLLKRMGYQFLREKKTNKSIAILELATREFPGDYRAFDSLGDGYMATGNKDKALINYTISLRLDPDNSLIKSKLNELNDTQKAKQ